MIVLSGAKLKLVDVDLDTLNIDHEKIEQNITKKLKLRLYKKFIKKLTGYQKIKLFLYTMQIQILGC